MTTLFLLAHQDDEIGVLHSIKTCVQQGEHAACAYLTDGAFRGVSAQTRNGESIAALTALGVPRRDIHFIGQEAGIGDGMLVENLEKAAAAVSRLAGRQGRLERVVMHALEWGHHDHDATHLVGRALAAELGIGPSSRQFSLYRPSADGRGMRYADPDPQHGSIDAASIPVADRFRYVLMLRHYRSQWKVMVKLGPYIVRRYIGDGRQLLQGLPPAALLLAKPPVEPLYERWKLYSHDRFIRHAEGFVASRGSLL